MHFNGHIYMHDVIYDTLCITIIEGWNTELQKYALMSLSLRYFDKITNSFP